MAQTLLDSHDGHQHDEAHQQGHAAATSAPLRVLIASDDAPFAGSVARRLRMARPRAEIRLRTNSSAAEARTAASVPQLLGLVQSFAQASALVLSLRSNMGGFLFSSWAWSAATPLPPYIDVDARVFSRDLEFGSRYFCSLKWGSRAGLCTTMETFSWNATCEPRELERSRHVATCCSTSIEAARLGCRACPRAPPVCSKDISAGVE